ncbi:hypothetical protein CKO24_05270 [Rhodothalassium salexigens DSM 2132]|nr:hypothetical protein [Rhodothalassium salexigens DSM 2132]
MLSCTILTGLTLSGPAMAQSSESEAEALKERVRKLEALVERLSERLAEDEKKIEEKEVEILETSSRLDEAVRKVVEVEQEVDQVAGKVESASVDVESMSQFFERERKPGFSIGDTQVTFGGYVKLDTTVSRYSDGAIPSSSFGRDFYIPSTVPVAADADSETVLDFSPRETRFLFKTETPVAGHTLGSHIELDFLITDNDNEVISNSFTPRMRQAFLTYRGFLFGQAWSTFFNVSALPENLDFVGPTEGTVFARQAMIRYTHGPFEVAIENPETTVTSPGGARVLGQNDHLPDLVARYTLDTDLGTFKVAGMLRQLRLGEDTVLGNGANQLVLDKSQTALGIGTSISGRMPLGERDDFRFMANVGQGLGRYLGLALVNGAAIDAATGELDPIFIHSGFASYRHFWSDRWRSNLTFSYFRADNPVEKTGLGVTDRSWSGHVNLLYSPASKLTLGMEYIYGQRRIEAGETGSLSRVQFSAKYGF